MPAASPRPALGASGDLKGGGRRSGPPLITVTSRTVREFAAGFVSHMFRVPSARAGYPARSGRSADGFTANRHGVVHQLAGISAGNGGHYRQDSQRSAEKRIGLGRRKNAGRHIRIDLVDERRQLVAGGALVLPVV